MNALIVDDEPDGRKTLKTFLRRYCPQVAVVAEAASVDEAVEHINTHHPALVFLDINMPYENGFGLFAKIPEPDFYTIFVTAHDAYALQAIKHYALDYILKPINIDELVRAVERAESMSEAYISKSKEMSRLAEGMHKPRQLDKIALPVLEGFVYVHVRDIIRCEAEGNYTTFYFVNRSKLLVCRTLGSYEDFLKHEGFVRVHHHHLINVAHVEKYQRGRGGVITMSDKTDITVSQRRKDAFLGAIEGSR
jgi:two-component system, LytTR family, response regulator